MISSTDEHEIYEGAMFMSRDELKCALGKFALKVKFEYRILRSCKTCFRASCVKIGCKFQLRATAMKVGNYWRVQKFVMDHTCDMEIFKNCHRQVLKKVIGSMIIKKLKHKGRIIRPTDVVAEMQLDHDIHILYDKTWRAKEYAQNLVYGAPVDSFQKLPSNSYMLERENPGTVTLIQTDEENRFEYFFMAIGPYITGFTSCIPVVAIDGTHPKGKYKGVLYVVVAMDGNEQMFLIAFGVRDLENNRGWKWFLNELHNVIGCLRDLILIFNHHTSIKNAVDEVFLNAAHGLCSFHMKRNLKKYNNEKMIDIFQYISRVYHTETFWAQMKELKNINQKAYIELIEADVHKWSRAYNPVRYYWLMTSNIAESINNVLRHAIKLSVTVLVEFIRHMTQNWFYDRLKATMLIKTMLTSSAHLLVTKNNDDSQYLHVTPIGNCNYEVNDGMKDRVVNLVTRTCTCLKF